MCQSILIKFNLQNSSNHVDTNLWIWKEECNAILSSTALCHRSKMDFEQASLSHVFDPRYFSSSTFRLNPFVWLLNVALLVSYKKVDLGDFCHKRRNMI